MPIIADPVSICCGNVNSAPLWVVTSKGSGNTRYSITSTDGINWSTQQYSSINNVFPSTGWIYGSLNFGYDSSGAGIFLATGYGGSSGSSSIGISKDGITWKTGGFPFANTSFGSNCYYGNGYWVVVGNSGNASTCVKYSNTVHYDGNASITWSNTGRTLLNLCTFTPNYILNADPLGRHLLNVIR